MTIYLGNQLIASSPERSTVGRNMGEIVSSTLPLNDFSLHLLDGAVLDGNGLYGEFTKYVKDLYGESTKYINIHKAGTPIDTNNVVSGFSSTDYLYVPYISNTWTTSFDFVLPLTTGSSVNTSQCLFALGLFSEYALALYLNAGVLTLYAGSNGSSYDITGGISSQYILSPNTGYSIITSFDGTKYTVKLSTDETTYTEIITLNSSTAPYKATNLFIGAQATNYDGTAAASPFLGSINMNYCSLYLDDTQVWTGVTPAWAIDEGSWQHQIETYGSCGKFVYDSTNNKVRLPKISGFIEGATDIASLGNITEAGLPNITGSFSIQNYQNNSEVVQYLQGAFTRGENQNPSSWGTTYTGNLSGNIPQNFSDFDASLVNPIYGNSTTVQPQTVNVLYYIVVNTFINSNSKLDIEQITTDLADKADLTYVNQVAANKADIDFSNVNSTGRSKVVQWSLPSNTTTPLSIMANVPTTHIYTAPSNGWIVVYGISNIADPNTPVAFISLINISNNIGMQSWISHFSNNEARAYIPVKHGDNYIINYFHMTSMVHLFVSPVGS